AGDAERSRRAMEAVDQRLVRRDHGLIQLLDPPFDKSTLNPGYIKGYVPGVRENGGQYTQGAVCVVAADVYALSPHTGRGGWTWYTGSAGWMYRLIVESLLGLRLEADKLRFTPCLPADWKAFKVHYRYRETVYHIAVLQTRAGNGEPRVTVDGVERPDNMIPLVDDRQDHSVEVRMAAPHSEGSL
ncbi:MAG: hypothetical protein NTV04_13595, partial [Deltaproteobacteria bacterium]|nr:hypothetical protein [Deltaproteobacteria bacterium]